MKKNLSESFDENLANESQSRLSSLIVFMLCLMLVVSTVAYGSVDVWATGLLTIAAGLIVLFWLIDSFINQEFRFSSNLLQAPIIGLILLGLIQLLPLRGSNIPPDLLNIPTSSALSLDPYSTRFFIIQLCIYLVFLAANLTFVRNLSRMRLMVFTIIVFGSLMAFFGVIQSLTNTNPNSILGLRENPEAFPFATFINRHHFAAFMNMTIGLTLGLLYGNATKSDKRLLLVIALVLMGIAMLFSGSRGGIISLLGVVAFVIALNLISKKGEDAFEDTEKSSSRLQRNFLLVGSGLALVLILVGLAVFFGGETSVTRGLGLDGQSTEVSGGRIHFWQTALQIIWHNPILGAGLDAFGVAFTRYDTWNGAYRVEQAHNEYVQSLADGGILGFLCVIAFIFFLFRQGLRIINQIDDRFRRGVTIGALAGCFGILVHSFFDFPLRTPANAFFFLTLAALATVSVIIPKHSRSRRIKKITELPN